MICKHKSTKLKGPKYCYVTNNSIKHHSFVYRQLNDQTVLFLTIQFNISHLFALSLNVKKFYWTHRLDSSRCYLSDPEWTWEWWLWRDTHIPQSSSITGASPSDFLGKGFNSLQRSSRRILQPLLTWQSNKFNLITLVYKEIEASSKIPVFT